MSGAEASSEPELHCYMPTRQFRLENQAECSFALVAPAADHGRAGSSALQQVMPGASYVTVTPMSTIIGARDAIVAARRDDVRGVRRARARSRGDRSVQRDRLQRRRSARTRWACASRSARRVATSSRLIVREGLHDRDSRCRTWGGLALSAGQWLAPLLFQVSPKDPPVFVGVIATLIAVAVARAGCPRFARRASIRASASRRLRVAPESRRRAPGARRTTSSRRRDDVSSAPRPRCGRSTRARSFKFSKRLTA